MKIRSYHLSMRNIMCYVQRNQYNTPAVLEVKKITSLTSLGNNPPKFDSRTEAFRNIVYFVQKISTRTVINRDLRRL